MVVLLFLLVARTLLPFWGPGSSTIWLKIWQWPKWKSQGEGMQYKSMLDLHSSIGGGAFGQTVNWGQKQLRIQAEYMLADEMLIWTM
jgi:hypothetical protein